MTKLNLTRIAAATLIAAAAASSSFAATDMNLIGSAAPSMTASATDKNLSAAVVAALDSSLGDTAKNVKVQSTDGTIVLQGWINGPTEEAQARKVASSVPGTTKVYSRLRTWSTETTN